MDYTWYQLVWYFFIYSFLGWCAETAYTAMKTKAFRNKGLLNGPFCPSYGITMVVILVFLDSLKGRIVFLSIGCTVVIILMEFFTGGIVERLFRKKWWDFSGSKFAIGSYVDLRFAVAEGIAGALAMTFFQPLLSGVAAFIPTFVLKVVAVAALVLLFIDLGMVLEVIAQSRRNYSVMLELAENMLQISNRIGLKIFGYVEKRMVNAYPSLKGSKTAVHASIKRDTVFARGCCFHKLVWLFLISAFLGDVTETLFVRATAGIWMSRSSVVYGPFSIVWGIGVVVLTMILHKYKEKPDRYIFVFGSIVGGVYEYMCSVFTEIMFGTVFWDYSEIPFNLGGRINLLYCFFWGFASVVWIKNIYPLLSAWIEKIPIKAGKCLSYVMVIFMAVNIVVSAMALGRYSVRSYGKEPGNSIDVLLDERFPDERMERIYPNAIIK